MASPPNPLDPAMRDLLREAGAVRDRAYAPYSRFRVGAALRGGDGRLYRGCNVENAAYPEGLCAEAGAIAAMVAEGCTAIAAIAVVGGGEAPCAPCGGCRQKIAEFALPDCPVVMANADGTRIAVSGAAELLPGRFAFAAPGSGEPPS